MPAEVAQRLNQESLKDVIRNKVNKKFEQLRTSRQRAEDNWIEINQAAEEGTFLSSDLNKVVSRYINLKDTKYASLVAQNIAQKLAYIKPDSFQLVPKPHSYGTGDIVRTDAIEHLLKDKFKSDECTWSSAWQDATRQLTLFNFGILHYSFQFRSNPRYKETYRIDNGVAVLDSYSEENELTYQGPKLDFINAFNFYLDAGAYNYSDLSKLDTYYREAINWHSLLADDRFNPEKPYINDARTTLS